MGAGLPVISTLRDLIDTGDPVISVEGIFSGTLAWLFNKFDGSVPFSQLVTEARGLGYTEPDPRDDLSGLDVARKALILGRMLGQRREFGKTGIRQRDKPGDLDLNAALHVAVFAHDRAQGGEFGGVAAIQRRKGGKGRQAHGALL